MNTASSPVARAGLLAACLLAAPATLAGADSPEATADAFAAALSAGNEAAALELLAPDVLIYESGGIEQSREEYRQHHLKADIAFLSGMKVERIGRRQDVSGDLAWVATRTRVQGTWKDKALDLFSTETLALKRIDGSWRITHVHWSSR